MSSVPFIDLQTQRRRLQTEIQQAFSRVMEHGDFINGPEVHELESRLSRLTKGGNTISCASGTDALSLILRAWKVGPGDVVIVPAFTFAATAEAACLVGATPMFADVDRNSFLIDADSVARCVDGLPDDQRLAAIIGVDLFGQPADYARLRKVSPDDVPVLADAAQSLGAVRGGRPVGSLTDATATSFFPAKPLGCYGDGGAVFTDDNHVAAVIRSIGMHGAGDSKYENVRIGTNSRLDTLQAAFLLVKLAIFDEELERRREVAKRYEMLLGDSVSVPELDHAATSAWAQYTIRTPVRDRVRDHLADHGIPTAVYYPVPLHAQPAFRDGLTDPYGLSVSEDLAATVVSLPMHPYLEPDLQETIANLVRESS